MLIFFFQKHLFHNFISHLRSIRLALISHGKLQQWERMFRMPRHSLRRGDQLLPNTCVRDLIIEYMFLEACHDIIVSLIRYTEDMELDDAIHTAILTLKEG